MAEEDPFTVCFTGHRELSEAQRASAVWQLNHELLALQMTFGPRLRAISGMAKGVDQIAANICIDLGIPWAAAIPHSGYPTAYGLAGPEWDRLLDAATSVVYVVNDTVKWKPTYNFDRNAKMLDWSNECIGVTYWDIATDITRTNRPRGGTAHALQLCIRREFPLKILQLGKE